MTRMENEGLRQFCSEKGHRGDVAVSEDGYDIFLWDLDSVMCKKVRVQFRESCVRKSVYSFVSLVAESIQEFVGNDNYCTTL